MNQGKFIVIEGLEGAGKSTALHVLEAVLTKAKIPFISTREPGGTELGEAVRDVLKHAPHHQSVDPRAELLLFYAARVQLLTHVIQPALTKGCWVLADRFELSSFAYQGGGRGIDEDMLHHLSAFCVGNWQPDLLFYLDIAPELGLERVAKRGQLDKIEQEPYTFFHAVHRAYRRAIDKMDAVRVIDASQPLAVVTACLEKIMGDFLVKLNVCT